MAQEKDYLDISVKLLKMGGTYPTEYKILNKFNLMHLGVIVYSIIYSLIFLYLVFDEITFDDIMELIEALGSYLQGTAKLIVLIAYSNNIEQLCFLRKQFWKLNMFGPVTEQKLKYYPKTVYRIIMLYICFLLTTTTPFALKPVTSGETPIKSWVPEGEKWFYVISFIEYLSMVCLFFNFTGFDSFFCFIYIDAAIQYKLLNKAFANIGSVQDIKVCAQHHDFISRFVKKMNRTFEIYLLFQYLYTMIMVCVELVMIADPSKDISIKVKSLTYLGVMYIQLSLTYLPASMLQDESEELSTSLLFCDWLFKSKDFHEKFIFMLKMSQRKVIIKAAGMFEVDRRAFIEAFRTAVSMYTLLVNI